MIIIRSEYKYQEECLMLVHIVTGLTGEKYFDSINLPFKECK